VRARARARACVDSILVENIPPIKY